MKHCLFLFFFLLGLVSCQSTINSDQPLLGTSIEPLRYLVEQIAGDRYQVLSLTPTGISPEGYEPTPQQLVELSNAKAYFAIGMLPFEQTKLRKIVEETPNLQLFTLTDSLELLAASPTHTHEEGKQHISTTDLHVWMSSANMKKMGTQICAVLSSIDSTSAPYFSQRLSAFEHKADSIDAVIRTTLKPISSRTFAIYHPALAYFAHDYGLTQYAIEIEGKEPTPQSLATLVNACRAHNVQTILVQEEFSGKFADKLAKELGLKVTRINPLAHNWEQEMIRIAHAFVQSSSTP